MTDSHPRFADRSVFPLLCSVFAGTAGTATLITALGKFVFDFSHRELDLGLLGLVEFAPAFLLVVVTGVVADRFERRRVASVALALQALCVLSIALLVRDGINSLGTLFVLVFAFGCARAFVAPSERSLPADMLEPMHVPWLMVRYSATWQIAGIAGPVLAGFLYVADPMYPFVAAALLYVLASIAVLGVRVSRRVAMVQAEALESHDDIGENATSGSFRAAFDGFRFVRSHPLLLGAISLDLFAVLFGGAVALLPAIAAERLHVGAVGLGWLRAAVGLGAGSMTLLLTRKPIRHAVGRTLLIAVAVFGAFTIVLGSTSTYAVAIVAVFCLSAADSISVFIRSTLVPLVTPAEMRGRVLSLENVFIGASNELGAFESGVAGQLLGAGPAVIVGGAMTIVVAVTWARLFPTLRSLNRFPDHA